MHLISNFWGFERLSGCATLAATRRSVLRHRLWILQAKDLCPLALDGFKPEIEMNLFKLVAISILSALATHAYAIEETVKTVTSRGQAQKFILTQAEGKPKASVILFAGGHGKLSLGSFFGSPSIGWGGKNNLVRTRKDYARQGFLVATVDAPDDRGKMNAKWRMSDDHAKDISAVVGFLKQAADVPVWMVGTSMGSFSAANMGIRLKDQIRGIVLTSSITRSRPKWNIYADYPNGIINMELSQVTGPVLLISHEDDGCPITPATDISALAAAFTSSANVEKALFSGGDAPISDPCNALSQHGFLGIEQKVVEKISLFIKSN